MEENEGQQICPNCNREIPSANFVIHTVHCTRNIKVCSVCKEPVPINELEDHHDRFHLLVPCKQCGEMARGTDMEDHIRDSCAFTMQPCRYCSLELRRREVPAHERYCGARTEQCAQCGEYVMQRYRQVHLDTNHGFVRLEEDAPPVQPPPPQPTNRNGLHDILPSFFLRRPADMLQQDFNTDEADAMIRASIMSHFSFINARGMVDREERARRLRVAMPRAPNRRVRPGAQANIPPQDDAPMEPDVPRSADRGAVRKRPAPAPPTPPETAATAATSRAPHAPLAVSTPPASPTPSVTSTSAVMSTPPASPTPSVSSTTAVKSTPPRSPTPSDLEPPAPPAPNATLAPPAASTSAVTSASASAATSTSRPPMPEYVPPPLDSRNDMPYYSALQRRHDEERRREQETAYNLSVGSPSVLDPAAKMVKLRRTEAQGRDDEATEGRLLTRVWYNNNLAGAQDREADAADGGDRDATAVEDIEGALEGLTPMSPEEFTQRFNMMQLRRESRARPAPGSAPAPAATDRFTNIRTSLRDLRRGLGEVTAPYNNNNNNNNTTTTAQTPTSTTENNNTRADNAPTVNSTTAINNPTPNNNVDTIISANNNTRRRRHGRNLRNNNNRRAMAQLSATVEYPFSIDNGPYDIYSDDVDMNIITDDMERTRQRQREALAEARAPSPASNTDSDGEGYLTCSFCMTRLRARDWLAHEETCTTPTPVGLSGRRMMIRDLPQASRDIPMIPCEFCTELMPFFVINEHQVLCREATLLYPD